MTGVPSRQAADLQFHDWCFDRHSTVRLEDGLDFSQELPADGHLLRVVVSHTLYIEDAVGMHAPVNVSMLRVWCARVVEST